jgi:hypothetical protein
MGTSASEEAVRAYLVVLRRQETGSQRPTAIVELSRLEGAFVEHAAGWAAANGVSAGAFAEEGVPAEVMARAGLCDEALAALRELEAVKAAIPYRQPFTVQGLATRAGVTRSKARQVIHHEIRAGRVQEASISRVQGSSRRPEIVYRRVVDC